MPYRLRYHPDAKAKDLLKLNRAIQKRIKTAIEQRLMTAPEKYSEPLRRTLKGYRKLTYLAAGRGLGATGAFSSVAAWIASVFSPEHAQANYVHSRYLASGSPLTAWLIFLLIGSLMGAAVSGVLAGRISLSVEKGMRISDSQRLWLAFSGGAIAALGAKIARGCTSGQALTGGSILNAGTPSCSPCSPPPTRSPGCSERSGSDVSSFLHDGNRPGSDRDHRDRPGHRVRLLPRARAPSP